MPSGLIIESSFTSIPDLGTGIYPFLPVRLISRYYYNAEDYIKNVKCPVLIVHSRNDEMILFKYGRRLFEAAKPPKEMLEITGSHNDGFITSGELYKKGLNDFIFNTISKGILKNY